MAMIDIRSNEQSEITKIKFADESRRYHNAQYLVKGIDRVVEIESCDGLAGITIASEEDAHHLIKALQKAIQLGWWSK